MKNAPKTESIEMAKIVTFDSIENVFDSSFDFGKPIGSGLHHTTKPSVVFKTIVSSHI